VRAPCGATSAPPGVTRDTPSPWRAQVDCGRAVALGLAADLDAESLVRHYAEDFPAALAPGLRLRPAAAAAQGPEGRRTKVVLITGGGTGIGRAVALRLARGGWQGDAAVVLVLTGRRAAPLEECAEAARGAGAAEALAWPADLTREAEVSALLGAIEARYGRLDLLFNNAGTNVPPTPFGEMRLKEWRHVLDTNLTAAFHVAQQAYRLMARQRPQGGRIINNGSVSAQVPRPGACAYTAAKCGLTGLTKSIALDGRAVGVACGQIDYGNVRRASALPR
jgi:NAD(P)-dependent dehydrogenase (short-subunit alcohol dehydrogenase family)